eukprot:CAMPEP_0116149676 /NCGR_PEP_ID=MMETSP0329-20121206/19099_1 /TAXON_ID=697910 /ORGANISM="Pseudo-nitzschia arenysensis, Strain B593" /LENGTH=622 /DNA_ID=CAMNT_0003646055 /DNA_START=192 /DNA_END=2060 /DNA_ORIENTATION=-
MSLSLTTAADSDFDFDFDDDDDDDEIPLDYNGDELMDDDDDDDDDIDEETRLKQISKRHYASTAAICFCSFTHSWLLVSVFPYSGFLVIRLVPGTNEETAGSYAGLLAASFMIGRALTSYGWGKIADVYGRRIVYFVSLAWSSIFSCLFGLSSSFGSAMLWRFLLGASNGVAGVNKTVVSETAQGISKLETRGMSVSMGMWAWGFLLSPALSGFLSDPIRQYPSMDLWEQTHPSIYKLLEDFPFFLPNLVSVLLCFVDMIAVFLLVPETLPKQDIRRASMMPRDFCCWLTSLFGKKETKSNTTRNSNTTELTMDESNQSDQDDSETESLLSAPAIELIETERDRNNNHDNANATTTIPDNTPHVATLSYLWSKKDTRNHLIIFWLFSFVGIAIDEASKEGGLGLDESEIGKVLSASGLFFALSQYHAYTWIVDKHGVHKSIRIGALLSAPLVALVPVALLLQTNSDDNNDNKNDNKSLNRAAFWYLGLLLSLMRIFGLVFFSSITIATNRTVLACHRGTMNGLSMLGGSIAKGLGPIAAGLLMTTGIGSGLFPPRIGAAVVFLTIGVCAVTISWITVCLLGGNDDDDDDDDKPHQAIPQLVEEIEEIDSTQRRRQDGDNTIV